MKRKAAAALCFLRETQPLYDLCGKVKDTAKRSIKVLHYASILYVHVHVYVYVYVYVYMNVYLYVCVCVCVRDSSKDAPTKGGLRTVGLLNVHCRLLVLLKRFPEEIDGLSEASWIYLQLDISLSVSMKAVSHGHVPVVYLVLLQGLFQ